jgi:hypothetical protein
MNNSGAMMNSLWRIWNGIICIFILLRVNIQFKIRKQSVCHFLQ